MALQKIIFVVLAVAIFFAPKGCHTSSVCGQVDSSGGWPWRVSITDDGTRLIAGGSLINEQWILTVGYKFGPWLTATRILAHLGSTDPADFLDSNVTVEVAERHCHPNLNAYKLSFSNDICLLRLTSPVNFTHNIQPVCLAAKGSTLFTGVESVVAGFGSVTYAGQDDYHALNTSIVGQKECRCFRQSYYVNTGTICSRIYNSSLQDVGAPLMLQNGSVLVQGGVLSVGCSGSEPCIYTDVSEYQDWITSVIEDYNSTASFVNFTSPGEDSDKDYICDLTTTTPTTIPTTPTPPTTIPITTEATEHTHEKGTDPPCNIFDSADKMAAHLLSLSGLILVLYVMG